MWKKLSDELPKNVRGVLYNERYDEVYVMDLTCHDEVAYLIPHTYSKWAYVVVIKPCDYDQWWWCELPGPRD